MRWPSKEFAVARARQIVYNESDLVVGYNMKPRANALIDVSPNTNDGTIVGAPSVEKTVLGDSMYFDGVGDYIDCGTPYALTDLTVSMWFKPAATTNFRWLLSYYAGFNTDSWGIALNNANQLSIHDDIDNAGVYLYLTALLRDKWYHVVAVMDNLENLLYVDGVLVGSGTFSSDNWASFVGTLYLGSFRTNLYFCGGNIVAPKLYSEAKNATWVAEQYALGANAVQGKTDWGAQESVAAEATAGDFLSNTPFRIISGSWQVDTETVDGKLCKVIECASEGAVYIPTTMFKGSPTEDAYGTWDWWMYKVDAGINRVLFMAASPANWNDATQNGYQYYWANNELLGIQRNTGGVASSLFYTATGFMPADQWMRARVTRGHDNSFTGYANDQIITPLAYGTNPIVNAAHVTASYVVFYGTTGSKLAYSDLVGDHSFVKKLGVVAP